MEAARNCSVPLESRFYAGFRKRKPARVMRADAFNFSAKPISAKVFDEH
jgi:hypothetical protein